MAALPALNPTFLDLTKSLAPDGSLIQVAEVLNSTNEGMDEMTWQVGNLTDGHVHAVRTGLPDVTWGQLYKGVKPSKGEKVQVVDKTGFMESLSEVDDRLLELAPDGMQFRAQEDRPHIQVMNNEFFRVLFKGTVADTDKFIGLEPRFSLTTAENGSNIIDGGGDEDTDLTSIWLIGWSPTTVFGIVPKGTEVGLQQEDWGKETKEDADGGLFKVWRTYWRWNVGLAVEDWRYIVRAANIDISELTNDAATGANLPEIMADMMEALPSDAWSRTRPAFYMSRRLRAKLRKQLANAVSSSTLSLENVGGVGDGLSVRKKFYFDGVPVNRLDLLDTDEAHVA